MEHRGEFQTGKQVSGIMEQYWQSKVRPPCWISNIFSLASRISPPVKLGKTGNYWKFSYTGFFLHAARVFTCGLGMQVFTPARSLVEPHLLPLAWEQKPFDQFPILDVDTPKTYVCAEGRLRVSKHWAWFEKTVNRQRWLLSERIIKLRVSKRSVFSILSLGELTYAPFCHRPQSQPNWIHVIRWWANLNDSNNGKNNDDEYQRKYHREGKLLPSCDP